jgi:hypothetical protein
VDGNELNAVIGQLVGDRDSLARIAGVITDLEVKLLAENAARGVEVGDGLFGTTTELVPLSRVGAGHRPHDRRYASGFARAPRA